MTTVDGIARARRLQQHAVFSGDTDALAEADRELDAVEAALTLARGRVRHTRYLTERVEHPDQLPLLQRAAEQFAALGDIRGEAEAVFSIGVYHQVVHDDHAAAEPFLARSLGLVTQVGDDEIRSYVLRHLGVVDHVAGRLDEAKAKLTESNRLRRQLDLPAGVAANLVGLAYIALAQGRPDDARAALDEADELCVASGAHAIARQVAEARAALSAA